MTTHDVPVPRIAAPSSAAEFDNAKPLMEVRVGEHTVVAVHQIRTTAPGRHLRWGIVATALDGTYLSLLATGDGYQPSDTVLTEALRTASILYGDQIKVRPARDTL